MVAIPLTPRRRSKSLLAGLATALLLCASGTAFAQANKPADGLDLQHARDKFLTKGKKAFYTKTWDLSGLPDYKPTEKVSGTIRIWGANYITDGNIGEYWEKAFQKFHPDAHIEWHMKTTIAAVPSLVFDVGDIGIGRKITFAELLMFQRYKDRDPVEIVAATGSYDVTGWQPGFGIVVHKDNPMTEISMEQLDGVFGAERLGGWEGTSWHPEYARGPEKNIRFWGGLGLGDDWSDKMINPYGLNQRYHQAAELSDWLLHGSDKWNGHLRIYANYVSEKGTLERGLNDDLAKDPYGIAYIAAPSKVPEGLKVLKLSRKTGEPGIPYTMETVRNRTYPMFDQIYMYADRQKGKEIDPKVKEFMRFVVSRQGQELIEKDGKYLPLTADVAQDQWKKLQ